MSVTETSGPETPDAADAIAATQSGLRADAVRGRRRGLPVLALTVAGAVILLALLGPFLAPHDVAEPVGAPYAKPGADGLLGTDLLGRDLLSRVLSGGRVLILVATVATLAAALVGGAAGLLAGYGSRWVGAAIMRIADVMLILPPVLVLLVLATGWGAGSTTMLVIVVVVTEAPMFARVTRAATVDVAGRRYVEAAVARGEGTASVLVREILPNVAGTLLANAGLLFVTAIYLVATASFLGVGQQPPAADWAGMISENMPGLTLQPWAVAIPALLIVLLAASVNVAADGLYRLFASGRFPKRGGR